MSHCVTFLGIVSSHVLSEGRNCTFMTFGIYKKGFCTFYGACRIQKKDYMYQGGCERKSQWGAKVITTENISCKVRTAESATINFGQCNSEGKCVTMKDTNTTVSRSSPQCAAYEMFLNRNLTIEKVICPKKSKSKNAFFLEQVYYFLGGLGNALTYASRLRWDEL